MRLLTAAVLTVAACDASEPPAPAASPPSDAALRLARFEEREQRRTCLVFGEGAEVAIADVSIRFDAPLVAEPETREAWVPDASERATLGRRGNRALIVPFVLRGAQALPFGCVLVTSDGATHAPWPANQRLWTAAQGGATALVFDVDPATLEGAVLYLTSREHHAVVDLAAAIPTEPIRGG